MKSETAENRKLKFGFLVLHYLAYEMTFRCVSQLLDCFGSYDMRIVIVDNGSENGSGRRLKEAFARYAQVTVLFNEKNDGFARGNNLGWRCFREHDRPDYIIVMNNDVLIDQKDFLVKTEVLGRRTAFAVLGPDIVSLSTGKHQNPAHLNGFTRKEAEIMQAQLIKLCRHPLFYYCKSLASEKKSRLLSGIRKDNVNGKAPGEQAADTKLIENPVLHGACYVFSREFIDRRELCFCPDTFLYMEEDILHYECMQAHLKTVYSPEIRVTHVEDVSTNESVRSAWKRFRMKNNEMRKSLEILLRKMGEQTQ